MAVLGLRRSDQAAGEAVLLHAHAPRLRLRPAQVELPALAVHPRKVAARVVREDRGAEVRAIEQALRVELREEPQRAEQSLQPSGAGVQLRAVGHLPADGGELLQTDGAQAGGEERQLRAPQHRDSLTAVQKNPAALLRDLSEPASEQGAAELEDHQPLPAQAQPPRAAQRVERLQPLAAGQIPVVQQPLAGGGRIGQGGVAAAHGLCAAADLRQRGAQGAPGPPAAALAARPQQAGGGYGVVAQPRVLDIQGEILVHVLAPSQNDAFLFFPRTGFLYFIPLLRKNT